MAMTASRLIELAERCEQASGPDRKLDLAIAVAVNRDDIFDSVYEWRWGLGGDEIEAWEANKRKPSAYLDPAQFCPRVSASLDAAMSLVPKQSWVRMDEWPRDVCHGPVASVQPIREPPVASHVATGSTLALALTAACLRALAQGEK